MQVMAAGAGGATLGAGGSAFLEVDDLAGERCWHFLTADEARLVEAISEQIIPTDQDAGAREAGVVNFIDLQLVGPYQRYQAQYRSGLACVQQTSQEMFRADFEQLAWDNQTAVLKAMETGKVSESVWKTQNSRDFFRLLRDHSMQGFYGSPRHGGNRDYVSYRMMGLEYPRIIGQNRYRT
jgi:gluconate 2-dehydrogenase gamma chain